MKKLGLFLTVLNGLDQAVYLSYRIVDFAPVLVLAVDYVLMHLNHVNQLAVVAESFLVLRVVELDACCTAA